MGHAPALKDASEAAELVASIELVSAAEMRNYFPDSEIWFERIVRVPKPLVAIKATA